MNISITTAKGAVLVMALALAMSLVSSASAEVTIVEATLDGESTPLTVAPGASVTVDVTVARTGAEEENDWEGTSYQIDDEAVVCLDLPDPDIWQGTDNSTTSFAFTAPVATGTYDIEIGIYRDDVNDEGAEGNNPCPDPDSLRSTTTLTLVVEDDEPVVIDPFIDVIDLVPSDAIRNPGDNVTYTANIQLGGDPEVAHLQCVVFDIINGDGWQEIPVDINASGTHAVNSDIFDLTGFATGTYDVVTVAFDTACAEIPGDFDPETFDTAGLYATTTLTVGEAYDLNITLDGSGSGSVAAQGVLSDDIACVSDGTQTDCSGTYASGTVITLIVSTDGDSDFSGWTTNAGNPGNCAGVNTPCDITILGDVSLNATFDSNRSSGGGGGGGGGNGIRLSLSDPDYNSTLRDDDDDDDDNNNNDDDEDEDEDGEDDRPGQVLGESTSVIPVGAPNTGAGGAAPLSVSLPFLMAVMPSREQETKSR